MIIKTVTARPFDDYNLMVVYEDADGNVIPETTSVPKDLGNADYQEILRWVAEGNTIADAPVLDADYSSLP
jgi:hypothetical protein